jgi:hypothetical protein
MGSWYPFIGCIAINPRVFLYYHRIIQVLIYMYFSPYPLQRIEEVGAWAGSVGLTEQCRSSNGFVGILSATTFVDTPKATSPTLSLLETCLVAPECLQLEVNQPALLAALLDNHLVGFPVIRPNELATPLGASPKIRPDALFRGHFST